MSQPRDDRQDDLFRPVLEEIINLRHPLVRLAGEIDWVSAFATATTACIVYPPLTLSFPANLHAFSKREFATTYLRSNSRSLPTTVTALVAGFEFRSGGNRAHVG